MRVPRPGTTEEGARSRPRLHRRGGRPRACCMPRCLPRSRPGWRRRGRPARRSAPAYRVGRPQCA
eukprot:2541127-Lingulodinium_polyedra.AAC.1